MGMNDNRKSSMSLCAKSMKMVVNVVKLSTYSISKMSLETFGSIPSTKSSAKDATTALTGISRSQRAQGSEPVSYLMEQGERNISSYAVNEKKYIDSKASDYIKKVREKNQQDLS